MVEEDQRVTLAVVVRKLRPPLFGRPILVMFIPRPWPTAGRGRSSDGGVGDGLAIGLGRLLYQGNVLGERLEGGLEIIPHGAGAGSG